MTAVADAGETSGAVARVAIVDDDLWVRAGRQAVLDAADGVEVVWAGDHRAALEAPWQAIDVALVDAHDAEAGFDRFAGVAVAATARRAAPDLRIVVLSGHSHNDLLRIRMAEAGADEFHAHRDVATPAALVAVVRAGRGRFTDETNVADARRRVGLSASGRLNEAVAWASERVGEPAIEAETLAETGLSRRRLITAREKLSTLAGLEPRVTSGARRTLPSWREVVELVDRARGRERRAGPLSTRD